MILVAQKTTVITACRILRPIVVGMVDIWKVIVIWWRSCWVRGDVAIVRLSWWAWRHSVAACYNVCRMGLKLGKEGKEQERVHQLQRVNAWRRAVLLFREFEGSSPWPFSEGVSCLCADKVIILSGLIHWFSGLQLQEKCLVRDMLMFTGISTTRCYQPCK